MTIPITETFYPKTRSEWRRWLQKFHDKKSEIWVVYFKKVTGKPTITYEEAVLEALCFGWIDGIEKGINSESFAGRFTPRKANSNWSESNIKRYQALVKQNLMTEAGKKAFDSHIINAKGGEEK
jgi:uncharacterized protein YdeI (YjbR/CyaY-like superfamily)